MSDTQRQTAQRQTAQRPTVRLPVETHEMDTRFQVIYTANTEYLYKLVKLIGCEHITNTARKQLIEMFKQNVCELLSLDIRNNTPESLLEMLQQTIEKYADFQKVLMDTSDDSTKDTADINISETGFLTLEEFKKKYKSINMRALMRVSHSLSHIALRLVEKTSDSRQSFVTDVENAFMDVFKLVESSHVNPLSEARELSIENICDQVNKVIKLSVADKKFWL